MAWEVSAILDWIVSLALIVIGLIILLFIVKVLFLFLPAAIVAIVVWFLTGKSTFWAGIAFLVIAVLSIAKRE
ncbi:MAG: hypothetical protein ACE5OW_01210 [Candidatus Bathyarchaeia archaeon]